MILAKEKINTGRQNEVDLLKAFTVVFSMIIIHVFDFDTSGFENDFTWWIDTIFGGIFAAPIFMFCMGIGMEYSRNSTPKQTIIRGLKLLTIGQVLNLFRYSLVLGLKALIEQDDAYLTGLVLNLSSDIMQLAGLSFLVMGLFRKFNLKNWQVLLLAILMNLCGMSLEHVQTSCYAFNQFLGLFWGTDTESYFPLFNWFIFVAAGKCFGSIYQRVTSKDKFFAIMVPFGIIAFALIWYLQKHTDCTLFNSFDPDYFGFSWMRLPDTLSIVIMAPAVIGLFYLISKLLPEKTIKVLTHPSRHINQYYCVSWWWIMLGNLNVWAHESAALMSVWFNIVTLTIVSVVLYNNHLKDYVEAFCTKHKTILTILVWVITLGLAFYAFASFSDFPNEFNGYYMK